MPTATATAEAAPRPDEARRRRARWWLWALVAAVATIGWTSAALLDGGGRLHDAPVMVVGPDVVTAALIAEMEAIDDHPLTLGSTEDPAEAAAVMARNDAIAVLEIDLAGTDDTLTLNPRGDVRRDDALVDLVTQLEEGRGRTVEVRRDGEPWVAGSGLSVTLLAYVAVMAGFVGAVVISAMFGPVARTFRRAIVRVATIVLLGLVLGGLAALVAPGEVSRGSAGAALCAAAIAGGLVTFAFEAAAGLRGLLGAAVILLGLPLPLLIAGDPLLLADPWSSATEWTVAGAAAAGMVAGSGHTGTVLPGLVLGVAITLALAVLLLRRWALARSAAGATPDDTGLPPTDPTPAPLRRQLITLALSSMALAMLVYYAWAQGVDRTPPQAPANLASATTCTPTGPIETVADLNAITRLRGSPQMRGGDIGASATLQDGRRIWLFGDTIRDSGTLGGEFVRNSMIVVEPDCLQVVVPQSGGAVIPDRDQEVGYWPMSAAVASHPGYDLVAVMAQRVRTVDDSDVFGFEVLGPSVAIYVVPTGGTPQLLAQRDVGADDPDTTRPMWGAASTVHDGWLYLYGTARPPGDTLGTGFALNVARVRPEQVADPGQWRFWDGAKWRKDASAAVELIGAEDGVSETLSVFVRDGVWHAFSKRDEMLGQDLVFWTADAPTGPFTAQPPVGELPSDAATGTLRYMPLAHPDLLPADDSMVISYSRNRLNATEVLEDPLLYRIRFARVDLPRP